MTRHKIIAVTPAGRQAYLEILQSYILADATIDEWHLWDNCRTEDDRVYLTALSTGHSKIHIIRRPSVDGSNRAINQFYRTLTNPDAFYIKLDDDIVYLPTSFGASLCKAATAEYGRYSYWSPLVVNNALCSWLLKYHSGMEIRAELSAAASCTRGWKSPWFAECLHRAFLEAVQGDYLDAFKMPNFEISLSRFSINCLGLFGRDILNLGDTFCPLNVDDEEWISAVVPTKTGRPGRIIGDLTIAHFAFFTQEDHLLKTDLLNRYFQLAGVTPVPGPKLRARTLRQQLEREIRLKWFSGDKHYHIAPKVVSRQIVRPSAS